MKVPIWANHGPNVFCTSDNLQPKLDNARKLREIYFIDPEDKEVRETINARRKLETPIAPAMPCKTIKKGKHGAIRGKSNEIMANPMRSKQDLRGFWKLMNPPDCVWENQCQIIMKVILQERAQYIATLQFGVQIYFYASGHKHSSSNSSSKGLGKIGENFRRGT